MDVGPMEFLQLLGLLSPREATIDLLLHLGCEGKRDTTASINNNKSKTQPIRSVHSSARAEPRQIPTNNKRATKCKHPIGVPGRDMCSFSRAIAKRSGDGYIFIPLHASLRETLSTFLPTRRNAATASRKNLDRHARKPRWTRLPIEASPSMLGWMTFTNLLGSIRDKNRAGLGAGAHFPSRPLRSKPDTHIYTYMLTGGGWGRVEHRAQQS